MDKQKDRQAGRNFFIFQESKYVKMSKPPPNGENKIKLQSKPYRRKVLTN